MLLVCWAIPMDDVAEVRIAPTDGDVLPPDEPHVKDTILRITFELCGIGCNAHE